MEMICFSTNVRQCNIAYSTVHVQLCLQIFLVYYYISFLSARAAVDQESVFVPSVGLCECRKITNVHPILKILFKDIFLKNI